MAPVWGSHRSELNKIMVFFQISVFGRILDEEMVSARRSYNCHQHPIAEIKIMPHSSQFRETLSGQMKPTMPDGDCQAKPHRIMCLEGFYKVSMFLKGVW